MSDTHEVKDAEVKHTRPHGLNLLPVVWPTRSNGAALSYQPDCKPAGMDAVPAHCARPAYGGRQGPRCRTVHCYCPLHFLSAFKEGAKHQKQMRMGQWDS